MPGLGNSAVRRLVVFWNDLCLESRVCTPVINHHDQSSILWKKGFTSFWSLQGRYHPGKSGQEASQYCADSGKDAPQGLPLKEKLLIAEILA